MLDVIINFFTERGGRVSKTYYCLRVERLLERRRVRRVDLPPYPLFNASLNLSVFFSEIFVLSIITMLFELYTSNASSVAFPINVPSLPACLSTKNTAFSGLTSTIRAICRRVVFGSNPNFLTSPDGSSTETSGIYLLSEHILFFYFSVGSERINFELGETVPVEFYY